jgi:hypothetical protein
MQKEYLILNINPSPATVTYDIPADGGKRKTGTLTLDGYSITSVAL